MSRIFVVAVLLLAGGSARAEESKVNLPLRAWEQMLDEVERAERAERSPVPVTPVARNIQGSLRKGLFSGTLTARFVAHDSGGHVRVPVLDSGASLGDVRLDGERTSLLREGGLYTVGVDRPGEHRLSLEFFWGEEQDRFARRLQFRLPDAGPTRISILIPEQDIDARLDHGVLTAERRRSDGTLLEGQLDPSGVLSLAWNRKLTHRAIEAVRWEARQYTLFTVQETLIQGLTAFDLTVVEGETDRVDLRIPSEIEVVRVEGDAVLQWHTSAEDGGRLTVLFRYLVEEDTRVTVHFQFPTGEDQVTLHMPLPPAGIAATGALGVQGPAGLNVQPVATAGTETAVYDLPAELTDLTATPLLFGLRHEEAPEVGLKISRHESVELTSTIIDDLQASTVLLEDGSEVTKVKLRIRNNTRQYLSVKLPEGAVLTHSLIDGQPTRPAAPDAAVLLFPLRQSERLEAGRERTHVVTSGETLSDLSNFYFSDPNQWRAILEANRDRLAGEWDIAVGQELRIPARTGAAVQESSFVIELAYKRKHSPLGWLGRGAVSLPEMDVDTVEVTWHLYLPRAVEPLSFDANLTQYSAIRYDPFRRVRDFLRSALWIDWAWAGGGSGYQNILRQRKGIYAKELGRKTKGKMVLSAFPLVGERYRFKHILIGQETPRVSFFYADRDVARPLPWLAMLAAFVVTLLILRRGRATKTLWAGGATLVALLLLGHFILGTHRRIVWGVDLALLLLLLRANVRSLWQWLMNLVREPWLALRWVRLGNLLALIGVCLVLWLVLFLPLLLSTIAAGLLFIWWRRQEVSHA